MTNYVTAQTFDCTKVVLGDIVVKTEPVLFQRILIKYQYDDGIGPLIIRTHKMFTFGLCETRDLKTNKVVGYSMPFVSYDTKEGMKPEDEEFITMIETLTNTIRQKVGMKEVMGELKKKRSRKVDVEALSIMKTRMDKPDAPPVMFVKLRTEYGTDPPNVTTPFFRKATKAEKAKKMEKM